LPRVKKKTRIECPRAPSTTPIPEGQNLPHAKKKKVRQSRRLPRKKGKEAETSDHWKVAFHEGKKKEGYEGNTNHSVKGRETKHQAPKRASPAPPRNEERPQTISHREPTSKHEEKQQYLRAPCPEEKGRSLKLRNRTQRKKQSDKRGRTQWLAERGITLSLKTVQGRKVLLHRMRKTARPSER